MRFRMVDRIIDWEPARRIRGLKSVSFEEYQLSSATAGDAHLPPSLAMECLVAIGRWLVVLSSEFSRTAYLVDVDRTQFLDVARPGETLSLEAEVRTDDDREMVLDARAMIGRRLAVEMTNCCLAKDVLSDYDDPDDLRVLFSEIHRPTTEPRP